MVTAQFIFKYDNEKHAFKIKNDASRYTVSELSFEYLEDYEVYNFTVLATIEKV